MSVQEYSDDHIRELLPYPSPDANKYSRGRAVLIGGSAAYPGAICLAAAAAQRAGAGYTEVMCAPESVNVVHAYRPSLVVRSWESCDVASTIASYKSPLACVIGSGTDGSDELACARLYSLLECVSAPVVVDGGAISALATERGLQLAQMRAQKAWPLVVTPHAGEAARMEQALCASDATHDAGVAPSAASNATADATDAEADAPLDSAERACALARGYHCTVVLKGSDTFISSGNDTAAVTKGTAALAKAGTGDVLAGMVGALLAQGLDPQDAAVLAVTLHAEAGCIAAEKVGLISVTAEDVINNIGEAFCKYGSSCSS